ncbi:MAG TPA: hypothetical protein VFL59_04070 [Candidatus Nanopelagicales bacterium]|nr:hypothetical protein [Candidatus Nanopelagicales bacterium]
MASYTENGYTKLEAFRENGYVVLEPYAGEVDPQEWLGVEWVDWKSSGETRFAPLASAYGDVECDGFWNHTPPKTDKDGVWIESQTALAPTLTERAQEPGANVGRCRIIELQPNQYGECLYNLHRDDNNRLNPEGTGWIVRGFFNLTDDKDSMMVLREVKDDPTTETRIALPKGAQLIVDTQRLYHAVYHPSDEPRYCLITSWESGPELDAYIEKHSGVSYVESYPLSDEEIAAGEALAQSKRDARAAALAARGQDPRFGDGTLTVLEEQMGGGMEMEQLSEA